jgi:hypothetical protein
MRHLIAAQFVCLFLTASAHAADEPSSSDYRRDVEPLFNKYCNGCHNRVNPEGKFSLDSFDDLLKGGKGGVAIVPGRIEQSRLILMLTGGAEPRMPPDGNEAPTAAEVAVLKAWVAAGAKGPTGKAPDPTRLVTPHVPLKAKPRDAVTAVAVSPTTDLAALGSYTGVRRLSLDDQAARPISGAFRGNVADLEFSRDGKWLAAAAGEPGVFGEAKLYDVANDKWGRTFTGHRDSLYAVALSADAKILATGSYDQTIKLWDAATGKELRTLNGHNGAVFDVAFHPSGKILASAGADRTIKLWDVAKGTRLDTLGQPTKDQFCVAFSPDGKTLVAGGADNRIRVWKIGPGAKENTNPLTVTRFAHEGAVLKLAFSADGKTLVSSGEDRIVRIWDAATLVERRALEKQPDWAPSLALSQDGTRLVVGRMDGTFAVYDAATGKVVPPSKPELAGLSPRGIMRGKSSVVALSGKFLGGVTAAALHGPSGKSPVAMVRISADGRTPTSLRLEVTPDAKLSSGSYQLVVRSAAGESNSLPLFIDDLPQLAETEPNDAAPRVEPTLLESAYWGICERMGDVDHFRFTLAAGESLVCRLEAKSVGSKIDGTLTLLDPAGEVVAAANDFDADRDPLLAYRAAKPGTYTVRVRDQALAGSAEHFYRLTVGTFPLVTGVFPPSAPVGRETNLELVGFNLPKSPAQRTIKVKPTAAGMHAVPLDETSLRTFKRIEYRAVDEAELVEREPNDAPQQATVVPTPAYAVGRVFATGRSPSAADVDLFRFESQAGQAWIIETEAARRGSPVDTRIEVLDVAGKPVPRVLLQAVRDSYVTFRSINSTEDDVRLFNWEEMQLNQYLYFSGEVTRLFRMPQGPDSGFRLYLSNGKRRNYFDTSSAARALDEPAYIVEPHPIGTKLVNNGLPVITLNYANDDDGLRKLGSDSRLTFTAPKAGPYLVRVSDVRGFGGDRFHYRLVIREPRPDFLVKLNQTSPTVARGSGLGLTFNAERIDGFDDEIEIVAAGLPNGYRLSTPIRIEAGHDAALAVLNVAADAKPVDAKAWAQVKLTARGKIGDEIVERPIAGIQGVTVVDNPKVLVTLEPAELTIAPGTTISATLKIARNGFQDRVAFNVFNLPHGVIVDNIGLNGILIPEGQTERQIFLTCYDWVPETERTFFAQTTAARAASPAEFEASNSVTLKVRKPSTLVKADDAATK